MIQNKYNDYDVLIIGGGLVGASMARALAPLPLSIGLVDDQTLAGRGEPGFDVRAIALAYGSRRILEGLDLWTDIAAAACPIQHIHISDRGHFGISRLHAEDYGVPALGYVCEADDLGRALARHLPDQANLTLHLPAQLAAIEMRPEHVQVTLDDGSELHARLVVAADGSNSPVREALDVPTRRWDYGQTAVIATVQPGRPHQHIAYERFTDSGPMALLPLPGQRCSLVWTVAGEHSEELLQLPDAAFLQRLGERFGTRLGRFERVGRRQAFPLSQVFARDGITTRLALIGNAAHTLHPVAGQGFNLGLRDIAVLAEVIAEGIAPNNQTGDDIGDLGLLRDYQARRRTDQHRTALFTDGLARVFSNPLAPVALLRNIALAALDLTPPVKRRFARSAMGLAGPQPRLALGLPLTQAQTASPVNRAG